MGTDSERNTLDLVTRIRSGDASAFRELIDGYERLVGMIVFRLIPGPEDREDIFQDVFLKVYQNLDTFRFESKLSTWIARIAYNTCMNVLVRKKIPLLEDRIPDSLNADSFSGNGMLPDEWLEKSDLKERLHQEIAGLDPRYRTIITLYHLQEMSYEEIGEIMELPSGTVKSYLHRARKQLRTNLIHKYREESLWKPTT